MACGILACGPGMDPEPPALGAWTTREVPMALYYCKALAHIKLFHPHSQSSCEKSKIDTLVPILQVKKTEAHTN